MVLRELHQGVGREGELRVGLEVLEDELGQAARPEHASVFRFPLQLPAQVTDFAGEIEEFAIDAREGKDARVGGGGREAAGAGGGDWIRCGHDSILRYLRSISQRSFPKTFFESPPRACRISFNWVGEI
ncbi:MAG: hypothetical protein OK454_02615 [Thaumarchaeota archaeon]|nr:hypothetical protein [Nitrososphaerota archaeon]